MAGSLLWSALCAALPLLTLFVLLGAFLRAVLALLGYPQSAPVLGWMTV
ncbi:hypothetical protein [Kitasatospora viridis]|nr:hypothetical protein [Kitasatospora viridis]